MSILVFKLFFTIITWLGFGSIVSSAMWDFDVKKMPYWWKLVFALPVILLFIALFVTIIITIWTA